MEASVLYAHHIFRGLCALRTPHNQPLYVYNGPAHRYNCRQHMIDARDYMPEVTIYYEKFEPTVTLSSIHRFTHLIVLQKMLKKSWRLYYTPNISNIHVHLLPFLGTCKVC
jgi:hypothetical protein